MYRVAVLGHSLVPSEFVCNVSGVQIFLYRRPGATWDDINCVEFRDFWARQFDLAIILLGGNDLAFVEAYPAFCKFKEFVQAALHCSTKIIVYSVEPRDYDNQSRFNITTREFNVRRRRYNRMARRWIRRLGQNFIDLGKPWIARERTRDGVHFNAVANQGLTRSINRVIRGVFQINP